VEFILAVGGITLVTGQRLGADLALDDLRNRYDAVFLGLGHNAVNALGLANEEVGGVHNAVDFIREIRQRDKATLPVGRRVVVIGGGNTAIDIAVQVKKLGAESVTLVYRRGRSDMGATAHEQQFAQTNGVLIRTGAQPVAIHAEKGAVTGVGFEYTRYAAGQRPAGSDDTFVLPADQLFKAIGQTFVPAPFQGSEAPHMEAGRIVVDPGRQSSLPDVWAGGDCVPGQDLTVVAVQDGKLAADSIHRFLES
jgi:glutamate synthase (NADPH/NADH) small chain